jgi:DNA repair protein RadC
MNLSDLKKGVDNLSTEELTALLLDIRQSRRTSKKAAAPKKVASQEDTKKLFASLAKLSDEEKADLLKQIQGDLT